MTGMAVVPALLMSESVLSRDRQPFVFFAGSIKLVQLLEMVDNSSSLCTSPLGWFFRQWAVRTDHFTLQ